MKAAIAILAAALTLGACATGGTTWGKPAAVAGQPDTLAFRLYYGLQVPESEADRAARENLDAYRAENGYRTYEIVGKRWNNLPTYFEYTARFAR